jgi:uncharacterized protein YndB with AHSA1/START domain
MSKATRAVELTLEIDARQEEVWRALTESREIVRWFAPDAKVTPGKGGSVWLSWGGDWEGDSRIEIWDPPRHLRTVADAPPYDADGKPAKDLAPLPIALDYFLEGQGGTTRLRLVHSGFGQGAAWDDELEGVSRGWAFELRSLRHYLVRHPGRERRMAWARATTPLPSAQAWRTLADGYLGGFAIEGRSEGDPYEIRTATGEVLAGKVHVVVPAGFAGTAAGFGDGLFRVWVDSAAGERMVLVALSAWDTPAAAVDAFGERAAAALKKLFPRGAPGADA